MSALLFPNGGQVTLRVKGANRANYRSVRSFNSYGANPVTPAASAAHLGRVVVLAAPSGLTSITSADAGARARVTPRSDGLLTVDMRDAPDSTEDLTITLSGTRDGEVVTEDLIATVNELREAHGQGPGLHPHPEVRNAALVYRPSTNHRKIYVSLAGLTETQIEAREPGSINANGSWLANNPAAVGVDIPEADGVLGYGEIPALALHPDRARQLAQNGLPDGDGPADRLRSVELIYREGDDFDAAGSDAVNARWAAGRGPLHPSHVRSYGTDEDAGAGTGRPVLNGLGSGASSPHHTNWVHQDILINDSDAELTGTPYSTFVNVRCDNGGLSLRGEGGPSWGLTAEKFVSLKNINDPPTLTSSGASYKEKAGHTTGVYVASGHSTLIKDAFLHHTGWEAGYGFNAEGNLPDPPEQWSQGGYFSSGGFNVDDDERFGLSKDLTIVNMMSTEAAANGIQLRPGGVILGGFFGRSNVNALFGGGPDLSNDKKDGNYTYAFGFVVSGQAYKDTSTGNSPTTGVGVDVGGWSASLDDYVVANVGALHPANIAFTDFRSSSPAVRIKSVAGTQQTPVYDQGVIWGWTDSPSNNPNSVPTTDLDQISAPEWLDQKLSTTGSTWEDFNAYCETSDTPWEIEAEFRSWARALAGFDETPRAAGTQFTFAPDPARFTPGCRFDIPRDWSTTHTGKLSDNIPGAVAGDSVDLDGHLVHSYLTLDHDLVNFDLGEGGHLVQVGGHMAITGSVTGTGTLETDLRGILKLDGASIDLSNVTMAIDACLENHGTLTGATTYPVRGYGEFLLGVNTSSFTLPSGGVLELNGCLARAGWDGDAAETATADFQAGSDIVIKPGIAMEFSGFDNSVGKFIPGSIITGATSGATARATKFWHWNNANQTAGVIYLDDVSGSFQVGESITGSRFDVFNELQGETLGTVDALTTMIPHIKKESFGLFGANDPVLTANVMLAGAWDVDVTNIANGTYTLMDCDAIAGTPSGFTATGLGGSRDATLTIGASAVTLTLAAGTGVASVV